MTLEQAFNCKTSAQVTLGRGLPTLPPPPQPLTTKRASYTQIAFSKTFDVVFESERDFLKSFQRLDCYLDDLCLSAVNHLPKPERRRCRRNGVESLAERIGVISPRAVVTVMRGIVPYVEKAVQRAGVKEALMFSVPFPTMGNQQRYVAELVEVLRGLQEATILTRRLPVQ